eukprot:2050938-Pleurochrysis_carterae.AAC.2
MGSLVTSFVTSLVLVECALLAPPAEADVGSAVAAAEGSADVAAAAPASGMDDSGVRLAGLADDMTIGESNAAAQAAGTGEFLDGTGTMPAGTEASAAEAGKRERGGDVDVGGKRA